jgi:hypothetical protein
MADRGRRALILVVAAAVIVGTATASRADLQRVRAEVTFRRVGSEYRALRVSITRGTWTWHSGNLGSTWYRRPTLRIRDLDADGEPEVLLGTYAGGAHCCWETRIFRYLPARRSYAETYHRWGNVSYRAINLDGRGKVELVSSDDRFAYVFTSFAGSFFPYQVWHFDRGRLRDVTRRFPGQIDADAWRLWSAYRENRNLRSDPRGVLAAWTADQYLLGRTNAAWATLRRLAAQGVFGPRADLAGWPQGGAYLSALKTYLRKLGYASG